MGGWIDRESYFNIHGRDLYDLLLTPWWIRPDKYERQLPTGDRDRSAPARSDGERLLEFLTLLEFDEDVRAADELTVDERLWDRLPAAVTFEGDAELCE